MNESNTGSVLQSVLQAVLDGVYDDQLTTISDTLNQRHRTIHQLRGVVAAVTIVPGDKVRLTEVSPKYLNGITGTVESTTDGQFKVKLDRAIGRYYGVITCKGTMLEKVYQ